MFGRKQSAWKKSALTSLEISIELFMLRNHFKNFY